MLVTGCSRMTEPSSSTPSGSASRLATLPIPEEEAESILSDEGFQGDRIQGRLVSALYEVKITVGVVEENAAFRFKHGNDNLSTSLV